MAAGHLASDFEVLLPLWQHFSHCSCCLAAGQFPKEDTRRLFTVVVDEAIKQLQPGQDQFLGIFDLKGFSCANIDLSFATFVIDAFLAMYPGRWVRVLGYGLNLGLT